MTTAQKKHNYTKILDEASALLDDFEKYPIPIYITLLQKILIQLDQCYGSSALRLSRRIINITDSLQHSVNVVQREKGNLATTKWQRSCGIGHSEFTNIRNDLFMSIKEVAQMFEVSAYTVRRWDQGITKPSKSVFIVMKTLAYGLHCFPSFGHHWEGWRIQNGLLYDPGIVRKYFHTPGTIRAWFLVSQMIHNEAAKENVLNSTVRDNSNVKIFPGIDSNKWDNAIEVLQNNLIETLKIEVSE